MLTGDAAIHELDDSEVEHARPVGDDHQLARKQDSAQRIFGEEIHARKDQAEVSHVKKNVPLWKSTAFLFVSALDVSY